MAIPQKPKKVKLFIGMLSSNIKDFELIKKDLKKYGEIDYESDIFDWKFTKYYNDELGEDIKKKFIFFKNLIKPEDIVKIKLETNKIEERYSKDNKRQINLDPGYLTLSKVLLATAKDYSHKIYIGKGIYGDVVLTFRNNTFEPHTYTFKDFRTKEYIELFNKIRELIK